MNGMANLRIDFFGRMRFDGFGTANAEIRVPLANGDLRDGQINAIRDRSGKISATLRLNSVLISAPNKDAKDGILKERRGERELGTFSTLCPTDHATRLLTEFFAEQENEATSLALEIGKMIEIATSECTTPARNWRIVPDITGETKNSIAKYLLMQKGEELIFGWDESWDPQHSDIWNAHEGTENLGGGFMSLDDVLGLRLTDRSTRYGQPPFELVYDAALAVLQAARGKIDVKNVEIEGAARFELK